MSPITTHVLDIALGRPAVGIAVSLAIVDPGGGTPRDLARASTDADGRVRDLLPADAPPEPGVYRLRFEVGDYLASRHPSAFYDVIDVRFRVDPGAGHLHVPLLLGPFGYSTYRGS